MTFGNISQCDELSKPCNNNEENNDANDDDSIIAIVALDDVRYGSPAVQISCNNLLGLLPSNL